MPANHKSFQKAFTAFSLYESGFTLIELLVVIAIVSILAVGLIAAINPAAQLAKARDATRKSDVAQIRKALAAYAAANGSYPAPGWIYSNEAAWQTFLSSELKSVPVDPTQKGCARGYPWEDGSCFWYQYYSPDGTRYFISVHLENKNDSERCELKQWKYLDGNSLCAIYGWSQYGYYPGFSE